MSHVRRDLAESLLLARAEVGHQVSRTKSCAISQGQPGLCEARVPFGSGMMFACLQRAHQP